MKKHLYMTLSLAILLLSATTAMATTTSYLLSGTVAPGSTNSPGATFSGINVSLTYDTTKAVDIIPAGGTSPDKFYVFDPSGASLTINGNDWRTYVPFKMNPYYDFLRIGITDAGEVFSFESQYELREGFAEYKQLISNLNFSASTNMFIDYFDVQAGWFIEEVKHYTQLSQVGDFFTGTMVQSPTPIPGAVWLLGSGLIGLLGLRRKRLAL